jgi:tetratricopeptide (TPR) repeat protein
MLLVSTFLLGCLFLPAQSGKTQKPDAKKAVTMDDAKIYRDAMAFFKKAEDMIGTPKENSDEQMELFRKAIEIKPDFLEAHYNLGLIYGNRKQMKEASAEFEKVLKLDPKFDPNIYFLLASAYQDLGNTRDARTALEEGIRRKPGDLKMLRGLAYLQFSGKEDDAAIRTLNQILEIEPTDLVSRIELAQLYQKNNQPEPAISNYQDALRIDPANFVAHYNLGLIYLRQKNYSQATAELEAANQARPGNAELLERLGDVYSVQGQHAKAVASYRSALEKETGKASLFAKAGFSLAYLKREAEAATALEQSSRLDPQNPDTFFLLGDVYGELNRPEDAIIAYKRAIEINPKQKEVRYNLGTLYAEQNRLDDAATELKTAVQLDPAYAPAWSNLALVAEKLGLDQESIRAHEKVIALGKGQSVNYFRLGILLAKSAQPDASIAAFAKAIEVEPDKYRAILREELKKVRSVLDSVRYKESFTRLLNEPAK